MDTTWIPFLCRDAARIVPVMEYYLSHEDAEFEVRVGKGCLNDVRFEEVYKFMEGTESRGWEELQDFLYVGPKGEEYRTRTRVDGDAFSIEVETIRKERGIHVDLRSDVPLRVASKREVRVPSADVPQVTTTRLVRIKQTVRYVLQGGRWACDCSIVWSGATKSEAELAQREGRATFEVELELLDREHATRMGAEYMCKAALLHMKDILDMDIWWSESILQPRCG